VLFEDSLRYVTVSGILGATLFWAVPRRRLTHMAIQRLVALRE